MISWLEILGEAFNEIFQFEGRMSAKKFSNVFKKWFRIMVFVLAPSIGLIYFFNSGRPLTDFSLLIVLFNLPHWTGTNGKNRYGEKPIDY